MKQSMINHSKIFCKSCLTFCEISLLVEFSRIVFIYLEKIAILCLTVMCLDV